MVLPAYIEKFLKIQEILQSRNGVELPQVVAIGTQNSGKSSVLERIIGHDVLPKGDDLVTRCPIVINLRSLNVDESSSLKTTNGKEDTTNMENEYATFVGTNDKIAICDIKKQIIAQMNELCGDDREIKNKPIYLNIFLKKTGNITLVDLPGLTKMPVDSQPKKTIDELNIKFCKNSNSLILAIINGCVDLFDSESLKIARMADPDLKRTVGVITKLDLVGDRTLVHTMLENTKVQLGHGYVSVVNRNTNALKSISMDEHIKKEDEFFKKYFNNLYPKTGSKYFVSKVYNIFNKTIKEFTNGLTYMLETEMSRLQDMCKNDVTYMYRMIDEYTQYVCNKLNNENYDSQLTSKNISLGSYINFEDLRVKIKTGNMFFNETEFRYYINKKIVHIHVQALDHVRSAHNIVAQFFKSIRDNKCKNEKEMDGDSLIDRLSMLQSNEKDNVVTGDKTMFYDDKLRPSIINRLNKIAVSLLDNQKTKLVEHIKEHHETQKSCTNISHSGFSKTAVFLKIFDKYASDKHTITNRKQFDSPPEIADDLMEMYISSYYDIVKKELNNYTVKTIHYYFVEFFRLNFKTLLLARLNDFKLISDGEIHARITEDEMLLSIIKDK